MFYIILTIILLITDQLTKYLTVTNLSHHESVVVIDNILNFTRYHNTGGPWSMFDSHIYLFVIFTILVLIGELWYLTKHPLKNNWEKICASLINAGAVGNLIDRIFRGYVVDMIEVKFIDYPIFNFADCCIVAGCILLCIYVIFVYKDPAKKTEKENDDGKTNSDM